MPARLRKAPMRSCIVCREPGEKRSLVRLVRGPGGTVAPDPTGRAPGRGAYLCREGTCLAALRPALVRRALRTELSAVEFAALRDEVDAVVQAGADR